jgi:hypothetical protein
MRARESELKSPYRWGRRLEQLVKGVVQEAAHLATMSAICQQDSHRFHTQSVTQNPLVDTGDPGLVPYIGNVVCLSYERHKSPGFVLMETQRD